MKMRFVLAAFVVAGAMSLGLAANASNGGSKDAPKDTGAAAAAAPGQDSQAAQKENMHLEGERRFRSNCARCHAAPPKFPPRMMATIVRHMRVRAAITDQDMRLILRYMTE
ncbi:MAG TPA: cytochrome c [Candidatus Angelobacter sp.]